MNLFTPVSETFKNNLVDFDSNKYYKFLIDVNIDGNYVDLTSKIHNNMLDGTYSEKKATFWRVTLKNSDKTYTDGSLAKCPCIIQAKCDDSDYFTIFTGYVSNEGADRELSYLNDDLIVLNIYDAIKTKGVTKKSGPYTVIGYNICNTNASGSLFHLLASDMGFTASKCDIYSTLPNVKDYLTLEKRTTTWKELQLLREAFLGMMYIRYDGKLRFTSPFMTDWEAQTAEWTFDASNIWSIKPSHDLISANYVTTDFDQYVSFDTRVIHKNTQLWNLLFEYNEIEVAAGEYWPGGTAQDVASLKFKDPKSGEEWPIAISIETPTIGTYTDSATQDILCSNGLLTLYSFNGVAGTNPSITQREPNAAQIILKNNTASSIYIRKLEIRGVPLRIEAKKKIEIIDPTISVDERIQKDINGRYVTSDTQGYQACKYVYDYGSVNRSTLQIQTHWLPQAQLGAVVNINLSAGEYGPSGINKDYYITNIRHPSPNGSNRKLNTFLILQEYLDYTPTGSPSGNTQFYSGDAGAEVLDTVPTFNDLQNGYTTGGGTTTPSQVTISECRAVGIRAIQLQWDRQVNLTNFDHYEIQVSDDDATWYSLKFDGTDWKDALGAYTECPSEFLIHAGIPFGGTADNPTGKKLYYRVRRTTKTETKGDWSTSSNSTTRTVNPGELAANCIYANNFVAGIVDTLLLYIQTALYIGYSGSGSQSSPSEGDRRMYVDGDELQFQVYTNGGWSAVKSIVIGGVIGSVFLAMIGCQGIYHPENPLSNIEYIPESSFLYYDLENNVEDQFGVDLDSTSHIAYSSSIKKFNSYSLTTDGYIAGNIQKKNYFNLDAEFAISFWLYVEDRASASEDFGAQQIVEFSGYVVSGGPDKIWLNLDYDRSLTMRVQKNGIYELSTFDTGIDVTVDTWHYITYLYNPITDILTLIYDDEIVQSGVIGGSFNPTRIDFSVAVRVFTEQSLYYHTTYIDDLAFSQYYKDVDVFLQHYYSGLPWNPGYSQADIILRPNIGGRIIFDDNQNESSCGTLHLLEDSDRPSAWVLYGGAATSWTDVDFSVYVPYGVKALLLKVQLTKTSTASTKALFRKNGSTETDENKLQVHWIYDSNESYDNGVRHQEIIECDNEGIIEYMLSVASGVLYLNLLGYWI